MKTIKNDDYARPVAYVATNKQRVKQHNGNVYLKDKTEFQIELYNPTNEKLLAKITLNGNPIGDGIVVRPGERIFLDRFISENRKFMFKTYEVDGGSKEIENAIKKNGDVNVEFFYESKISYIITNTYYPTYDYYNPTARTTDLIGDGRTNKNCSYISGLCNATTSSVFNTYSSNNKIETGMIEKGNRSNQTLENDFSTFNYFSSFKTNIKILPESNKLITSEDIVVYCSSCGRRKRTKERFCPSCGHKL